MARAKSDIQTAIYKHVPQLWHPYLQMARMDRPIGTWLLFLPCLWGIALGQISTHGDYIWLASMVGVFAIGSFVARSAGCVWNDIVDIEYDRLVARTATRPLAKGDITKLQAIMFVGLLVAICFVLFLLMNWQAQLLLVGAIGLVGAYPYLKRVTYWPQLWLGLTFNWGVLVGFTQISGDWPNVSALCLYGCGIFWTLGYDTIYALQDIEDDLMVGVKSTAIKFGANVRSAIAAFYIAAIIFLALSLWFAQMPAILAALPAPFFIWQVWQVDRNEPDRCLRIFQANKNVGLAIGLVMILAVAIDV